MFTIKNICTEICTIITHLFNRSLLDGYFPNILKKSKIIPLYKSGDRKKPENYRPISLLPQLSNILERLIKNRILNFINKHNIMNECQYGFRNNISTADAISETIISDILESLQKCAIISIDLRKAFDTLVHTIFLNKLFILNISKTEMINFNSNKYPNNIISLSDTLINNVYNYKYLGIILDSKLDFKNHIIKVNNKLSQIQFLISKLSKFIKTNSLIIIFNSIFLPYLNYGNILW